MKITHDLSKPTVSFIKDIERGGCLVRCPHCREEFPILGESAEDTCPKCEEEIFYPGWASW